jgi:hypothetical protein
VNSAIVCPCSLFLRNLLKAIALFLFGIYCRLA